MGLLNRLKPGLVILLFLLTGVFAREAIPLQTMIGQCLMITFPEQDLDQERDSLFIQQLEEGLIGGIIFFKFNIQSPAQFRKLVQQLKEVEGPYPLLLAVDEEGGRVRRLTRRKGFLEVDPPEQVARQFTPAEAEKLYAGIAAQISSLGLNMNVAPVIDLNLNPENPVIGSLGRSFGSDPDLVSRYAEAFIDAHHDQGVFTVLKHFPGHGSSLGDSHKGLTDISQTWTENELLPYRKLIGEGKVDAIMSGHLMLHSLDTWHPASLSNPIIAGLLRRDMGFKGIVITDDLQMGAISQEYDLSQRIVLALEAGNDILQFSDPGGLDLNFPERFQGIVRDAIQNGDLDPDRIRESFRRVIELKGRLLNLSAVPLRYRESE